MKGKDTMIILRYHHKGRRSASIRLLCLLLLAALAALPLPAQVTHYLGLSPKLGYAAMFDRNFDHMQRFGLQTRGGVNAGLGLFYELEYNLFHFQTGLDFDYLNSASRITDFTIDRPLAYPAYPMTYHYGFNGWRETRHAGYLHLPVLFGGQFDRFYFLAGARFGFPLAAGYATRGELCITATDRQFIDPIENAPTHHITSRPQRDRGTLFLRPDVALSFEAGIDLDEWLAAPPPRRRRGRRPVRKTFKQLLHYRAGIYADYGLLSVNDYNRNAAVARPFEPDAVAGHLPVLSANTPDLLGMNTALATEGARTAALNPFTIGVKFTILYEFEKPVPPRRPRTRPRPKPQPKPKPAPVPPPPPHILVMVQDKETMEQLAGATVELYDVQTEDSLFVGTTGGDSLTHALHTQLALGTYSGYVRRTGYLPFTGVFTATNDTVHFMLQQIREDVITLLDVNFATNKTNVLPESAQVLEDLYDFLSENPGVRIRIIGHTDSVGSDEMNRRLSHGRARSVTQEMLDRGISPERIEYEGRGEDEPIADNETEQGRARNRRVEFIIINTD